MLSAARIGIVSTLRAAVQSRRPVAPAPGDVDVSSLKRSLKARMRGEVRFDTDPQKIRVTFDATTVKHERMRGAIAQ